MNHRELMAGAEKNYRFHFLRLPDGLQDAIITGLDTNTLTLHQAAEMTRERGFPLSHEAISDYYQAVRRERKIRDALLGLERTFEAFNDQPLEDNLRSLTNFLVAVAVRKLADGEVAMKVDLGQVLKNFAKVVKETPPDSRNGAAPAGGEAGRAPGRERVIDQETLKQVREQIYGLA